MRDADRASLLGAVTGEGAPYASEADDLVSLRPGAAEGVLPEGRPMVGVVLVARIQRVICKYRDGIGRAAATDKR